MCIVSYVAIAYEMHTKYNAQLTKSYEKLMIAWVAKYAVEVD